MAETESEFMDVMVDEVEYVISKVRCKERKTRKINANKQTVMISRFESKEVCRLNMRLMILRLAIKTTYMRSAKARGLRFNLSFQDSFFEATKQSTQP